MKPLMGVFETNLHIEAAQREETPLFLRLLDYKKLFDFIIHTKWGLATWWGIPAGVGRLLNNFYRSHISTFKFSGHFGEPWKRTNSLAQGCSFSMMLVHLPVTA